MGISTTTLFGTGNSVYSLTPQGGVYQSWAYTAPLHWNRDYSQPTPTGEAILAPTVGVTIPHNLFMGESSGYWVHKAYLDGHLVGTFTMVDQQFAIPVLHDRVESVSMGSGFPVAGSVWADCDPPDVPAAGTVALLLVAAVGCRKRWR